MPSRPGKIVQTRGIIVSEGSVPLARGNVCAIKPVAPPPADASGSRMMLDAESKALFHSLAGWTC